MNQYIINMYDNGAKEAIHVNSHTRKVIYNTGDIVYFINDDVVSIIPHDMNGMKWKNCENPNLIIVDSVKFPHQTTEALSYLDKQSVLKDPDRYTKLVESYMNNIPGKEYAKATKDSVFRFFNVALPSRDMKIVARRSGTSGFDVNIFVYENPALQDEGMRQLDILLSDDKNKQWLTGVFPWSIDYKTGVSYRHFSGDVKESQALLQKWFKGCESKVGKKNLQTESAMRV